MRFSQLRIYLFIIVGFVTPLAIAEENKEPDPYDRSLTIGGKLIIPEAFAGDYVVVGKQPDNGKAYSGSASLRAVENSILMTLRVGEEITSAIGHFEIPHPPGEGAVLRFVEANNKWKSTCLWHADLDNYFRLSCYKLATGVSHSEPGLESFFPISSRPAAVASKYSVPEN
jgi:hypothetical protein